MESVLAGTAQATKPFLWAPRTKVPMCVRQHGLVSSFPAWLPFHCCMPPPMLALAVKSTLGLST